MTCKETRQLVIDGPIQAQPYEVRQRWHEHMCGCKQCRDWLTELTVKAVRAGRTGRTPGAPIAERVGRLDDAQRGPERQAQLDELLQSTGGWDIPEEVLREIER